MRILRESVIFLIFILVASVDAAESNLCFNGNFSHTNNPLEGWYVDYQWLENKHYMDNHKKITVLPSYKGKKNVCWMTTTHQTKIESKLVPIEKGARYKCTMDQIGGGCRVYFNCYKWEPGVAPHPDPHIKELRRQYKSEQNVGGGGEWRTITFYLPLEEMTELAYEHYKEMRFFTIYVLNDHNNAGLGFTNVKVTKIPGATYKVIKSDLKDKTSVKAQFNKPGARQGAKPASKKDDDD